MIFERAGLSARAWLAKTQAHTLAVFPDTLQAATFLQDYKTLFSQSPELKIFSLKELPLSSQDSMLRKA